MSTVKAVLFDYGKVLSGPPDAAARRRMEQLLDVSEAEMSAAYWKFRDAYDRGALTGTAYWKAVGAELGRALNDETVQLLLEADDAHWTQPNEAMIAWAGALRRAGIVTGILSNLGDAMEAGLHAQLPWLKEIPHKTFSHRLGIAKPDAAIYRYAATDMGLAPEEILFIDDREENIEGAKAVGMTAILYDGHERFVESMRAEGLDRLLDV